MPNPDAAPQTPGKVNIGITPGNVKIEVDGHRLEQHVTGMRLVLNAGERPVLLLDLLPSTVDVTGDHVVIDGPFREFLIDHGWRPPA